MSEKVVPWNSDAEDHLLGILLTKNSVVADVCTTVSPEDFFLEGNQLVCRAVYELWQSGAATDPVAVAEWLERRGFLEKAGGAQRLVSLQATSPVASRAETYANIIVENAVLRRMLDAARRVCDRIMSGDRSDVSAIVDDAESAVYRAANRLHSENARRLRDVLDGVADSMVSPTANGGSGLMLGFKPVDNILSGVAPGSLVIVGARPAMGKTSFVLNVAHRVAQNAPVLMFSLEMAADELAHRMVSMLAQVDGSDLKRGGLPPRDVERVNSALVELDRLQMWIDDSPDTSVLAMKAKARRVQQKAGVKLGLIIVDYLQLMACAKRETRQAEVAEVSRGLKLLARESGCPVLAVSQLSRSLESRTDKRPMLSDLRESGAIEQDADVVIFLYRDEVYRRNSPDEGLVEVIVAKHRQGPIGRVKLEFDRRYCRFT